MAGRTVGAIPLVLSVFGLLLVLGMSVGCVGRTDSGIAYAESTPAEECDAGNTVLSLDMSGDMNLSTSVDNDISNGDISYLSKDFKVTACRTAGYKIYVQANSSKLQNQQAPDALLGVGENKAVADFIDNTWGYAVDEVSKDNTAMLYNTMPEPTTSRTESYSEDISTGASGKALKITFAAKFGKDKVAGHYTSDVLMSVVPGAENVTVYTITYDGNGNTGGTAPESQTSGEASATDHTFTVADNTGNLTKTGYAFAGWAETADATTAQYQPGGTITLNSDVPTKTLYAVWSPFDGITDMQQMTNSICAAANIGDSAILKDARDQSTYTVKKLSDKNCWMIQNLRLVGHRTLTPNDSNVKTNYALPASSSPWNDTSPTTNKMHYANNTAYGAYYTWYVATAGTGSTSSTSSNIEAPNSICPKGWRLPTGNTTGEFQTLYNKGSVKIGDFTTNSDSGYWLGGSAKAYDAAFLPAAGYVEFNSLETGKSGGYWSSTSVRGGSAYYLYFSNTTIRPADYSTGYTGRSIRCIAQ